MNYDEWKATVPETITADSLWKMQAYRFALFLADIGWHDVTKLMQDRRTVGLADQLYRSLGSIGANLAEGYSRGTGKDRARFYEYALGSARECRDWYYTGRHVLGEAIVGHRMDLIAQVTRLLLTMIPQQRQRLLHEEDATYQVESDVSLDSESLASLLRDAPVPEL